jgi:TAG lipase/steryl ester hydrolase/phospholipase A2/LPA acyltransferase
MTEIGFSSKVLSKLGAIIDQKYHGDITIVPEIPFSWYPFLISDPRTPMVASFTVFGEKATWPSTFS